MPPWPISSRKATSRADRLAEVGASRGRENPRPQGTPPLGTGQRIRSRAIWAVAFFTAAVPPALLAIGVTEVTDDQANVVLPLALGFWVIGLLFAVWAAFPTLRYWEDLPNATRWLGALPLLSVSLFFSAAMIGVLFR